MMTTLQQANKLIDTAISAETTALEAAIDAKSQAILDRMTRDELIIINETESGDDLPAWFMDKWGDELDKLGNMIAELRGIL
jgi:hypothetical protein